MKAVGTQPKTVVVVPVVRVVVVAVGATHVVLIVVERPATQHTTSQPVPATPATQAGELPYVTAQSPFCHAAQQPPQLGHHAADVLILAVIEPAQAMGQPQIEPHLVQAGVGRMQPVSA